MMTAWASLMALILWDVLGCLVPDESGTRQSKLWARGLFSAQPEKHGPIMENLWSFHLCIATAAPIWIVDALYSVAPAKTD